MHFYLKIFLFWVVFQCQSNVLMYLEQVTKNVKSKVLVDVPYLDFSKTSDKVPHRRILLKLKSDAITGCIINWIEDYFKCWIYTYIYNQCNHYKILISI